MSHPSIRCPDCKYNDGGEAFFVCVPCGLDMVEGMNVDSLLDEAILNAEDGPEAFVPLGKPGTRPPVKIRFGQHPHEFRSGLEVTVEKNTKAIEELTLQVELSRPKPKADITDIVFMIAVAAIAITAIVMESV